MIFLVYLIVFAALIGISWTPIATNKIGFTNLIPSIWESAFEILDVRKGNALSIIAMAFLLYALLQSKSVQALFASKRKWLQKRKLAAVAIITITVSLLASTLWWMDEFVHFYPLIIPFFLSMGFDTFSSLLCLYGGSAVGIIGTMANSKRQVYFKNYINPKAKTNFNGSEGFLFSVMIWVILTTILVFFNIWYCNKVQKKSVALSTKNQAKPEKIPSFNWRRKLILFLSFFFIVVSILGTFGGIAEKTGKWTDNVPEQICNTETETNYKDLGKVKVTDDVSPKKKDEVNENEMELAQKVETKTSAWKKFGEWDTPQVIYWFTIGGIIICLVAKLNIIKTLITTVTKTAPIILVYIFSHTVAILIGKMKLKITPAFLFASNPYARFFVLPVLFVVFFFLIFLSIDVRTALLPVMAPTLKSLSTATVAYSLTVIHTARMLAEGISPFNGVLQMSLTTTKSSYKEYMKKTWVLWTIIFFICLISIALLPLFIDRGSG